MALVAPSSTSAEFNHTGSVTVRRPTFPEGLEVIDWQVYVDDERVRDDLAMDVESFTVAHAPGETHEYRVSGRDARGFGGRSNPLSVKIEGITPAPPPSLGERITADLRDEILTRVAQQKGRARTVLGPEYVGRLRDHGMNGLADALARSIGTAIWNNADAIERALNAAEVLET